MPNEENGLCIIFVSYMEFVINDVIITLRMPTNNRLKNLTQTQPNKSPLDHIDQPIYQVLPNLPATLFIIHVFVNLVTPKLYVLNYFIYKNKIQFDQSVNNRFTC